MESNDDRTQPLSPALGTRFGQVAWVVPDIEAAARFFQEALGVPGFAKLENLSARELAGTYRGRPADFVFHLYMAASGDSLLELIQPVSGESVFADFLALQPSGGVQHVAYMVPLPEFEGAVAQLRQEGYAVVQSLVLPVASVAFFDTVPAIGVMTEIIGVTEAGGEWVAQLRRGDFCAASRRLATLRASGCSPSPRHTRSSPDARQLYGLPPQTWHRVSTV